MSSELLLPESGLVKGSVLALTVSLAFVAPIILGARPATAVDFPLTASAAHNAITSGSALGVDSIVGDTTYQVTADRETWPGFTPSCNAETPYFKLAFAAAEARTKYASVSASVRQGALEDGTISISTNLFTTVLGTNEDAVAVLKQGEHTIRSIKRIYENKNDVVESPEVGYTNLVIFKFNLKRFKPNKLFTVTFANVVVNSDISAEFNCKFNGSDFL